MKLKILLAIALTLVISTLLCSCSDFDDVEEFVIDVLHGHDKIWWTTQDEATCSSSGYEVRYCDKCGYNIDSRYVDPTGNHDYGEWSVGSWNCEYEHTEYRNCNTCGHRDSKTVAASYHKYGEWEITQEASCNQSGKKTRVCTVCGWDETEYFSGHILDENFVCTLCGKQSIGEIGNDWLYKWDIYQDDKYNVEYISAWKVNYISDEDCYELSFYLKNANESMIKVSALVDIRIVNDNEEVVYSKIVLVRSDKDFKYGPASVKISASDILPGSVSKGDFYFRVYNGYCQFSFDEICMRVGSLPVAEAPTPDEE